MRLWRMPWRRFPGGRVQSAGGGRAGKPGIIRYRLRQFREAEDYYTRALEADPHYALAHFNLGNLHDERGDLGEAQNCYEAALRINPRSGDAHFDLALLLCERGGDALRAVHHWKAYLRIDDWSSWAGGYRAAAVGEAAGGAAVVTVRAGLCLTALLPACPHWNALGGLGVRRSRVSAPLNITRSAGRPADRCGWPCGPECSWPNRDGDEQQRHAGEYQRIGGGDAVEHAGQTARQLEAAANPMPAPISEVSNPRPTTRRRICDWLAPSATRNPIS